MDKKLIIKKISSNLHKASISIEFDWLLAMQIDSEIEMIGIFKSYEYAEIAKKAIEKHTKEE